MFRGLKKILGDFRLFSKNFIEIIDNENNSIPFILNAEQEQFLNDKQKFNIILKGRQIGFTTFSLAYMLYLACTKPNTSYIIVTHHNNVTKSLFTKLKKMYRSLPHKDFVDEGIFPGIEINNRDELSLDNGSRIVVATAQGEDSFRGNTFQLIHFSEMAFYPESKQAEIIGAAIPALAKNPDSAIIIESTANGLNEYQKMFTKAFRNKESVWKAHFYSWLAEAYHKQFKHQFDEAEAWYKSHNGGRRLSKNDLELEELYLHEQQGASFKQLMFRRHYIELNSLDKFKQEFPSNPEEAFLTTHQSIFDMGKILERIQHALPPMSTKEAKQQIPLKLQKHLNKNLFIFKLPKEKVRNYAGIDVAAGVKADNSTCVIFDSDGQQMCSWYSNDIPTYEFAELMNELCRFYNYAFTCVERNSYGLPVLEKMRKDHGYMNLYRQRLFNEQGKQRSQFGFQTTNVSKPVAIEDFKEQFELGFINLECITLLEEMKIYEDNGGKMGNKKGDGLHDDLVIATAMAIQAMKRNIYYVEI
ncbi:terminase family protein [Priestia megaterium]|uniref:terminase large subunit domain-containing protein n=1 Tax=Priestia megaterium TaxID=1404 RepID=UPI002B242CF7|nr:terminase family protein [Priestia megaterium]MEB2264157.1 terminase family protein [Priestia megaterium]